MTSIHDLRDRLASLFPTAEIESWKSDDPDGFQFLNIALAGFGVSVEWHFDHGFGVSSIGDDSHELDGLYDSPDEWYRSVDAACHRIASILLERCGAKPRRATLAEVRHERGISQEDLSAHLNVKQATYSKLERRTDVKVSSLKKVVEAMGGKLRIQAIFPDTQDVREINFS